MTIPGQSVCQSVVVAKSPKLMSAECTTPMVLCIKFTGVM